jgi:excisionase family DNA binding protein
MGGRSPQAAEYLQIHPQTLYKKKEIPRARIGRSIRFKKSDLDKYVEQNTTNPLPFYQPALNNQPFNLKIPSEHGMDYSGGTSEMPKGESKTRLKNAKGIYTRKTKSGIKRFYISLYDPTGKRVRKCVRSAQTCEEAALARTQEIQRAFDVEYGVKRRKAKIKFEDFAFMYLEDYAKTNKRSWETDWHYLKSLKKFFHDFYLSEITGQDTEKYKKSRLKEGVQKSTVNRCLAILRKMLNLAKEWGYLPDDWKIKINFYPEKDNARDRVLTKDEETRLICASCEHLKPILIVALNTGMRLGEILNLQWKQIDFNIRKIKVEKTKSGKMRTVPINSPLLSEFLKLKEGGTQNEHVFTNPKTKKPFTTIKTAFKAACRRARVSNLRFHDLRGTVGTRLDEKGVGSKTISKILGHSSPLITYRHYIRPSDEQEMNAVELLAEKSSKNDESLENWSPICPTNLSRKKGNPSISLFSVN